MIDVKSEADSDVHHRDDRAGSSDMEHSDFEQNYRKVLLGNRNVQTLSPQSLTYSDFDGSSMGAADMESGSVSAGGVFSAHPASAPTSYPPWGMEMPPSFMPQMDVNMAELMLSQGLVESEFGTIKPHMVSCPNPEVMLGVGDPMIYSGYSMDNLRA